MTVQNKVAFITRAMSGIGFAAAELLAAHGAKVALLGHTESEVQEAAQKLRQKNVTVLPIWADTSKPNQLKSAYRKVLDEWGRLDIVFANTGINGPWAPLKKLAPENWDDTLNINLKRTFLTIKYAVPHMKDNGGSIIVTSSVGATHMDDPDGAIAYASFQARQVALTKMLALEVAPDQIRINLISPGWVETEAQDWLTTKAMDAGKTPHEFQEMANLVLFLASDASRHISGTEISLAEAQWLLHERASA